MQGVVPVSCMRVKPLDKLADIFQFHAAITYGTTLSLEGRGRSCKPFINGVLKEIADIQRFWGFYYGRERWQPARFFHLNRTRKERLTMIQASDCIKNAFMAWASRSYSSLF